MAKRNFRLFAVVIIGLAILLSACDKETPPVEVTTETTLEPWRVCAAEAVEEVLSAIKTADFDEIALLSGKAYKFDHFTDPECENTSKLFTAAFSNLKWTVGETTIDNKSMISIGLELTFADYKAAVNTVLYDEEKMTEVFRARILNSIDDDHPYDLSNYVNRYIDFVLLEMDENPQTVTTTETLVIRFNEADNTWRLITIPEMFRDFESFEYNVDPMFVEETKDEFDDLENKYWIAATELLYEEGEIDFSGYYSAYWRGCNRREMTVEEAKDRLSFYGWMDYDDLAIVYSYKAGDPELLLIIDFYVPQPGLMLYYEIYKDGQKTPVDEGEDIMLGLTSQYLSYMPEGGLKRGDYKIIVRIEDGSVLIEDTISVK